MNVLEDTGSTALAADPISSRTTGGETSARPAAATIGLLDQLCGIALESSQPAFDLDGFLAEPTVAGSLRRLIGHRTAVDANQLGFELSRTIARLDDLLTRQVNAIIHHPTFQRLEASWRGLNFLTSSDAADQNIKVRVLNVTWRELARDLERAIEFDQSQLFKKIYESEFGMPGGKPFGVLLGDYEVQPFVSAEHPTDDVATLTSISHVAAAAFAPFLCGVHSSMFGLDRFAGLEQSPNLERGFDQLDFLKWRAFRETEDSRFVGLALPRVLMRTPYEGASTPACPFGYQEDVRQPDGNGYLWGNAVYALGSVLIRSFADSGWLADIRGVRRGEEGGGLVVGLPVHSFGTDKLGVAPKCSTDVILTDRHQKELNDLGFISLCHCKDTEHSAFYSVPSVQKPKAYSKPTATANARLSSALPHMLCVSRFAHYLKVIMRDKTGQFAEAEDCEDFLQRWIVQYVSADADSTAETKAELPLREARIQVREQPGKPGSYFCTAELWPHYELEELTSTIRLATELTTGGRG